MTGHTDHPGASRAQMFDEAELHSVTAAALPRGHVLALHSLPPWSPSGMRVRVCARVMRVNMCEYV